MSKHFTMKNLPASERPYEKILSNGAESLSDAELLAIIIKTGTKEESSLDIARNILSGNHNNLLNLYDLSLKELMQFPGIGKIKAIQLKTVAELSRRIAKTNSGYLLTMNQPKSIADYYMEQLRHLKEEYFICAFFDAKCSFLGDKIISKGSVSYAYVSPKDVFTQALLNNAVLLVVLHNHPSGDPTPSKDDILITNRLAKGASFLDIQLADHIIIGDNKYYSFKENNQL